MSGYHWKEIEDLPPNWSELVSTELDSLASIWIEHAASLKESDAIKEFNLRLRREWAIETGVLENLYSIDRGITVLLIEKGIEASLIPYGTTDKPAERIVPVLRDQEEALEGLFDFVSCKRELSTSYIKELHQVLTRHQETVEAKNGLGRLVEVTLPRGDWKRQPNNPTRRDGQIHEYCPPEHVASEMDRLIAFHNEHSAKQVTPAVEAAWLHHRFTQIHPFQDGNGRIARALASLVFLRAGWFPLIVNRDDREKYIDALEEADAGDLSALVNLFSDAQKRAFNRALSLSETVLLDHEPLRDIISAAAAALAQRKLDSQREMQSRALELSRQLEQVATIKLEEAASALSQELTTVERQYKAWVQRSADATSSWFHNQIVSVAKQQGYYANSRAYSAWVRLTIQEQRQVEIVVTFHALGTAFLGIMAASAFLEYRNRDEDGLLSLEGPHPLGEGVFQFSYKEPGDEILRRFSQWLNHVLLEGLDMWRRQL